MASMRNNPVLSGALMAGLAAVTGPQMLKALAAASAKRGGYEGLKLKELANRFAGHADDATEAWKMVGGSGPTKVRHLGGGVDAQTFQVTPGGTVLKLARPTTHVGFDPHQIADTAPRDVMLPVLEHGRLGEGNQGLSWFVQPRAHVVNDFGGSAKGDRLSRAAEKLGQPPPSLHSALDELQGLLEKNNPDWRIIDQHGGNFGRWAGKDWVIDLGSMEHTPTRNALRHGNIARGLQDPVPQIPVRDTPITTPPGAPPSPQYGTETVDEARRNLAAWHAGEEMPQLAFDKALRVKNKAKAEGRWEPKPKEPERMQFRGIDTTALPQEIEWAAGRHRARKMIVELLERMRDRQGVDPGVDTPQHIRSLIDRLHQMIDSKPTWTPQS